MDSMLSYEFARMRIEENALFSAMTAAKAKCFALIVNLPQALDDTISMITRAEQYKAKMNASNESGDIPGRRSR